MSDLKASRLNWKRARRIILICIGLSVTGFAATYYLTGGRLFLDADGMITREHVAVSAPYDSLIREVMVRAGDKVKAGQPIAKVESATISRTLADLSTERAKLQAQRSQLEGRRNLIKALLPDTRTNAEDSKVFLDRLRQFKANGLAVDKTLTDMSAAYIQSTERYLSLKSEQGTIDDQLRDTEAAIREISTSYSNMKAIYNDGILVASADGYVASAVGAVGEMLSSNGGRVAQVAKIFTGRSFALAYIPENYMLDLDEGQMVGVKVRGQVYEAKIEKVLPVTDKLPEEFQLPNRARERGQMVRITMHNGDQFALEQKVRITSCYLPECRDSLTGLVKTAIPAVQQAMAEVGSLYGQARQDLEPRLRAAWAGLVEGWHTAEAKFTVTRRELTAKLQTVLDDPRETASNRSAANEFQRKSSLDMQAHEVLKRVLLARRERLEGRQHAAGQ